MCAQAACVCWCHNRVHVCDDSVHGCVCMCVCACDDSVHVCECVGAMIEFLCVLSDR